MRRKNKKEDDPLEVLVMFQELRIMEIDNVATEMAIAGEPLEDFQWAGHILLDEYCKMCSYTIITDRIAHYYEKRNRLPFTQLLDGSSVEHWNAIAARIQKAVTTRALANLRFRIDGKEAFNTFSMIHWQAGSRTYRVWFLAEPDEEAPPPPVKPSGMPQRDYDTIVALHDFILEHLSEPLPMQPQMARQFGTNQHKLKTLFQKLYGTSIYQFYTAQRLDKSWDMLMDTELPLELIAEQCGYGTYHNFSSSFKKRFKFPPISLRHSIPLKR